MRVIPIALLVALLIHGCKQEEKPPFPLPKNARQLLTNDSTKTWKLARRFNNDTRMNMGDCFLLHRDTYKAAGTMHNNSGENRGCGKSLDATWNFVKDEHGHYYIRLKSEQLPELMNMDEDYKLFKILHLSNEQMTLQFTHKQFSSKASTIIDVYVPEYISVEDRTFHW